MTKIRVTIDLDSADDSFTEWGYDVLDGRGVTGVNKEGVYCDVYQVRNTLVEFEDVEVLEE